MIDPILLNRFFHRNDSSGEESLNNQPRIDLNFTQECTSFSIAFLYGITTPASWCRKMTRCFYLDKAYRINLLWVSKYKSVQNSD